jgi:putative hydrolase of the HAD superfamily
MKAVLFDLDNTLTHRNKSIARFSEYFLSEFGSRLINSNKSEVYSVIVSADNGGYLKKDSKFSSIKDLVSHTLSTNLAWIDQASILELRDFWVEYMPKSSNPMNGVPDILINLKNLSFLVGVVSNGAQSSRIAVTKALKIDQLIDILVSSEKVGTKKPDSKIFHHALDLLGIKPSEAWFVGDHPTNDFMGSQTAGLKSVWLSGFHDWPNEYLQPEYCINSLHELLQIVA